MEYMRISDIANRLENSIHRVYNTNYIYQNSDIVCTRFPITDFTKTPLLYLELLRQLTNIFDVRVYRNKSSIHEGIYLVGRAYIVNEFKTNLERFLKAIENNHQIYGEEYVDYVGKNISMHGNSILSQYKSRQIVKALYVGFDAIEYKEKWLSALPPRVRLAAMADFILVNEYANNLPILKTKTQLYGTVRYIPKSFGKSKGYNRNRKGPES